MQLNKRLASCGVVLMVMAGGAVHAGRTLEEPPSLGAQVRKVPQRQRDAHLATLGLSDTCARGVQGSQELVGLACRLAIVAAEQRALPLTTQRRVQSRLEVARLGAESARAIEAYTPLHAPPAFGAHRLEAHRHACSLMVDLWDALRAARRSGTSSVRSAAERALQVDLVEDKALAASACACAAQTVSFATEAGATVESSAQLQSILTSRGCFLDEEQVRSERPAPSLELAPQRPLPAAGDSPTERLLAYARTREVTLARCIDKHLPRGLLNDQPGMETCVCGELTKWNFPKERGRPDLRFELPLVPDRLAVTVAVGASGKVTSCGPLSGPVVP